MNHPFGGNPIYGNLHLKKSPQICPFLLTLRRSEKLKTKQKSLSWSRTTKVRNTDPIPGKLADHFSDRCGKAMDHRYAPNGSKWQVYLSVYLMLEYDSSPKCFFLVWLINRNSFRAASYLVFKTMTYLNCLKPCILSFMFEAVAKTCSKCQWASILILSVCRC